jgi:regulator of RNase E activity RraA
VSDLVARLAALDACAVSDALDKLGLPGTVTGIHSLTVQRRIAGPARTVQLGPPQPPGSSARHLGTTAITQATEGDVIVIAHGRRDDCAGWGGNLSRAARKRGVAGVIVDGACRDIDEAREIDFPMFGTAAIPLTARGRSSEVSNGEPVVIGGVTVRSGDLVLADGSGVVFVDHDRAGDVIEAAEAIARVEAQMAARIEAGDPVDEVMGTSYESMLQPGSGR